jgi:hypothetical protein
MVPIVLKYEPLLGVILNVEVLPQRTSVPFRQTADTDASQTQMR